jgi:predicted AAA+ superfamily ATPase
MIERDLKSHLLKAAVAFPAITLTGPRQSGKSTLCRMLFPKHSYVNLEALDIRAEAAEDPRGFLARFGKGAIIDEIQRYPQLLSYLQEIIDASPHAGQWILTGSQNLSLLSSVSQSLAGRTAVLNLLPLAYNEICRFKPHPRTLDEILLTGSYPRIYDQELSASTWISSYVATYLERDARTLLNIGDLNTFQRFVQLCAGRTGQLLNASALAADAGIAQPTAKAWLSVLEASFIVFQLPSYSGNIRKRLVKMPKLHFYDTGLVCWLLGIRTIEQLSAHPLRGAIFETWVVSEIIKHRTNQAERSGVFYYRDSHANEADMLVDMGGKILIVEAKSGATFMPDMLKAARTCKSIIEKKIKVEIRAVYGGKTPRQLHGDHVLSWDKIHEYDWVADPQAKKTSPI